MKSYRIFLVFFVTLLAGNVLAQPPKRRAEQQQKQELQKNAPTLGSTYRRFPTAQTMPTDASWRRDLYRKIDLTREANATLYYPFVPQNGRENLFTYLFHLLLRKQVKAYDYKLDGNENFDSKNEVTARELMDRYKIYYESKDDKVRVNDADLPSEEVKAYFIKESSYYDQRTATFRKQVTAICPVIMRGDSDFGGELAQYPMCWFKMEDVSPYLGKLMLMGSSLNNAAMMSADDFFTMACYDGEIYKAVNLQDRLIANYCDNDSAVIKEQKRIEKQLYDVQEHVYGRDSAYYAKLKADSLAKAEADSLARADKSSRSARRTASPTRRTTNSANSTLKSAPKSSGTSERATKPKKQKAAKTPRSSSNGSGSGLSVRRQRH